MWRRRPAVAGSFYPSNPQRLRGDIESYIKGAEKKKLGGELFGLIVPHAGYVYSGPVAAHSYVHLVDSGTELAVVLAPSHRARFEGASVVPSGVFETPLGDIAVDGDVGEETARKPHITFIKEVHADEHSLEVQLPFLQYVLKEFTLLPVIVGTVDMKMCRTIAEELAGVLGAVKKRFTVVISTDLSHYHSHERAQKIDGVFVENLGRFDIPALHEALCADEAQACGEGPVLTGLFLGKALGARSVEVLKYATSGDTAGGKSQVVGYLAAALVK